MSNGEVLKKMVIKKSTFTFRKKQFKFLGYILMKEGLGNVITTRQTKDKSYQRKERITDIV